MFRIRVRNFKYILLFSPYMEILSSSLCRYSFLELNEFVPQKFVAFDKVALLELAQDDYQAFFSVSTRIDEARKDLLGTALYNLVVDSLDDGELGLVSRILVSFRPATKGEIEGDKQLIAKLNSRDEFFTPYDVGIPYTPRIEKVEAIMRAFNPKETKDITNIVKSLDWECGRNSNVVPQPYEIFLASNGLVKWTMFSNPKDYPFHNLQDFSRLDVKEEGNAYQEELMIFQTIPNLYL